MNKITVHSFHNLAIFDLPVDSCVRGEVKKFGGSWYFLDTEGFFKNTKSISVKKILKYQMSYLRTRSSFYLLETERSFLKQKKIHELKCPFEYVPLKR